VRRTKNQPNYLQGFFNAYCRKTQKAYLRHLRRLYAYESNEFMSLDPCYKTKFRTYRSFAGGGVEGTLISIMDKTSTAMGGRFTS